MKKAVIIHGTKGAPDGNWFPWMKAELAGCGFDVTVPAFPTPDNQSLENWFATFDRCVGPVDESTLLIGHSLGAAFILRLLERLGSPVDTVVIVAGFTGTLGIPEYDSLNESFISGEFDWDKIRANAHKFLCLSGDEDPYVPFAQSSEIARHLGVALTVIKGGGHLNAEFGFTEFPALVSALRAASCYPPNCPD